MALIGRFLLLKEGFWDLVKHPKYSSKNMNKTINISVLFVVMFLFSQNQAQASFFDWMVSKDQDPVLLNALIENRMSYSNNHIWDQIEAQNKEERTKNTFRVVRTHSVRATGYSSSPDQTDSTPFITASGTYVRDGIIAANVYVDGKRIPFGTMIRIPEIYGDKIFIVEDRMNSRYTNNIDVWFPERGLAKSFGSQRVTIEVIALADES